MGASLLAMAVCQSTSMLTGAPSSRASSLPQGFAFDSLAPTERANSAPPSWLPGSTCCYRSVLLSRVSDAQTHARLTHGGSKWINRVLRQRDLRSAARRRHASPNAWKILK
ncbi:hypothetical protein CUN61_17530 [Pseudomonas arsenicoxydans]|uniref:Uncharacterized protein n=1 Tax=Pseudomonas arsenicoxydans TaxID=702115 RepID=A0A4V0YK26_9PSED|nr:hypothetical protein CUN61_17530 [Pseudomonas arsenicoxydans]